MEVPGQHVGAGPQVEAVAGSQLNCSGMVTTTGDEGGEESGVNTPEMCLKGWKINCGSLNWKSLSVGRFEPAFELPTICSSDSREEFASSSESEQSDSDWLLRSESDKFLLLFSTELSFRGDLACDLQLFSSH